MSLCIWLIDWMIPISHCCELYEIINQSPIVVDLMRFLTRNQYLIVVDLWRYLPTSRIPWFWPESIISKSWILWDIWPTYDIYKIDEIFLPNETCKIFAGQYLFSNEISQILRIFTQRQTYIFILIRACYQSLSTSSIFFH